MPKECKELALISSNSPTAKNLEICLWAIYLSNMLVKYSILKPTSSFSLYLVVISLTKKIWGVKIIMWRKKLIKTEFSDNRWCSKVGSLRKVEHRRFLHRIKNIRNSISIQKGTNNCFSKANCFSVIIEKNQMDPSKSHHHCGGHHRIGEI